MEFELRFTDKEITAWGGMGLLKRMQDRIGFDCAMKVCDLSQPGSNRGYSPTQLILQFMLFVWCGANRFEYSEAKGKQLSLFTDDPALACYRFGALVTDLDLPAEELWRLYRSRADCENRI